MWWVSHGIVVLQHILFSFQTVTLDGSVNLRCVDLWPSKSDGLSSSVKPLCTVLVVQENVCVFLCAYLYLYSWASVHICISEPSKHCRHNNTYCRVVEVIWMPKLSMKVTLCAYSFSQLNACHCVVNTWIPSHALHTVRQRKCSLHWHNVHFKMWQRKQWM